MRIILLALLALQFTTAVAQRADRYRIDVDIANVINDRVRVSVWPPRVTTDTATVVFPVTVPGTYESHNWWKIVRNFTALDSNRRPLPVRRSVDSQFVIERASALRFFSYELEDTFDDTVSNISVFAPAGTSFEADSIFVLNHGGIIGYIDGLQKVPFQINVRRPKHLWGGSALNIARVSDTLDTYLASSYDHLVDSPVLYSLPDTASFVVEGVRVRVQCAHSGTDTVAPTYAKELAKYTKTIAKFLPSMPVSDYAFLFYLWRGNREVMRDPSAMGALEHSQSSFYFLGFSKRPIGLGDIAIHEFLHILVPLNLHSEEIDAFDFRNPTMSQHLWLYEGTTEYFATLAPVHDSSTKEDRFRKEMESNLRSQQRLPKSFSFTEFSRNVLSEEGQQLYPMVYTYGAVNAFFLDVVIRNATAGEMGLRDVIYRLMQDHGPNRPFQDDSLFTLIERVTNATVRSYLDRHIKGTEPLPSEDVLRMIGWKYVPEKQTTVAGFGLKPNFTQQGKEMVVVLRPDDENNPMGAKPGDVLISMEGTPLEELFNSEAGPTIMNKLRTPKIGDALTVTVRRNGQVLELKGTAAMVKNIERHFIEVDPAATPAQIALRNAVFYK
jgi:predicted metalloprotease with PDZ domain